MVASENTAITVKMSDDEKALPKHPLRDTLVISFSFMAIYTSYLAIQNLQSSLNQEAGLGVTSLACLYGTILISGTMAPSFIRIVGAKRSLVIAWIIHTIYTASNFYPTWATLIPSSILLGGIAGPQWTSQGLYLSRSGDAYSRIINENIHSALSKLNGIFFTCYEATQITGNLISSLVLQQGSYDDSEDNVTKTCGADSCPIAANGTLIQEPDTHVVYILLGIFLVCDVVGICLTAFLLPKLITPKSQKQSLSKSVVSCCTTLVDKKMTLLIPLFMSQAMNQGLLLSEYTKAFISCSLGISMVGFIMACFGGSTAILALLIGRLAKYTGRYLLFTVASAIDMGMLLTLYFWEPQKDQLYLFFIIPTVWGISEAIFQAQFNSLISILFEEKMDSAFANYHTSKAFAFTTTFVCGVFLCLRTRIYIAIGLLSVGFLGYIGAEIIFSRTKLSKNRKDDNVPATTDEKTHL
ncbi:hypothetical protein SNE40_006512 [Patella caerulea]|uniref:Uncharacterized protein n=2 Tax=Patella caerulea TaxID=87958 RepID=A0AAN8JXQ4_PATCE